MPDASNGEAPKGHPEIIHCDHAMSSRNLIVCIDGTANQFGEKNTNVIELYNLILKESTDQQRTWYNSGIGTYARPSWTSLNFYKQVLYHKIDLAIAWNFEATIIGAYRWLSDNYQTGDCIFLFGFSRGAYQVRVLAGMIDKVGLIYKGNEMQISFAFELYADPDSDDLKQVVEVGTQKKLSKAQRFKQAFSYNDVKVHFVGAWDTVSSIGVMRSKKQLPRTTEGMTHVCYFRHALALDERRVKFLPEFAYEGLVVDPNFFVKKPDGNSNTGGTVAGPIVKDSEHLVPHIIEMWFPGTHSDIGGGNTPNEALDRSRPSLRWMVAEAKTFGLRVSDIQRGPPNEQFEINESMNWFWKPLELFCFRRLTYSGRKKGKETTLFPHFGTRRVIHAKAQRHSSVRLSSRRKVPPTRVSKERLLADLSRNWWDLYKDAVAVLTKFIDSHEVVSRALHQVVTMVESVYGKGVGMGNRPLSDSMNHVVPFSMGIKEFSRKKGNANVENQLTVSHKHTLRGHEDVVTSAVFSPDGQLVATASYDRTIRIWAARTGAQIQMLEGHEHWVEAVAFLPDNRHLVSASSDETVRLWNVDTGKVERLFEGHRDGVHTVAVSPDGKQVASGSADNTIRIWDVETGNQVGELDGHTFWVNSVLFSADGKQILSGSNDGTVRIWDVESGTQIRMASEEDGDWFTDVAYAPNGLEVAASNEDSIIWIFDIQNGMTVSHTFKGHQGSVCSVAFSSDGKYLVSGSSDKTVRIWDVASGEETVPPLQGHDNDVLSVRFSPDATMIVSSGKDNKVIIWEIS